jgi:hypothetical protein
MAHIRLAATDVHHLDVGVDEAAIALFQFREARRPGAEACWIRTTVSFVGKFQKVDLRRP